MPGFLIRFIVGFFALGFTTAILDGIYIRQTDGDFRAGIALGAAALVLAVLNAIVRPVLIILTLPLTVVTLGLFLLVLNGLMLWLTPRIVPNFVIESFGWAVAGTIVMTLISFVLNRLVRDKNERR